MERKLLKEPETQRYLSCICILVSLLTSTRKASITCLSCLRESLYSGNGRQVLQDILSDKHFKTCKCASHRFGMDGTDPWTKKTYRTDCTERRTTILYMEGTPSTTKQSRLVDATDQTGQHQVRKRLLDDGELCGKDGKTICRGENITSNPTRENSEYYSGITNIILLLCKHGDFSESEAMEVLTGEPEEIEYMCSKVYADQSTNLHRKNIGISGIDKAKIRKSKLPMKTNLNSGN